MRFLSRMIVSTNDIFCNHPKSIINVDCVFFITDAQDSGTETDAGSDSSLSFSLSDPDLGQVPFLSNLNGGRLLTSALFHD